MNLFIYITINKINGKCYIGKHNNEKDSYFGSGLLIKKAIRKHGRKNFIRIKLKNIKEENHLLLEEYYIKLFDTLEPNGYNISPTGGLGISGQHSKETKLKISKSNIGKKASIETKKKLSESHKGITTWNLGKPHSIETREKISKSKKGKETWMKGKQHSLETKQKISNSKKANPVKVVNHSPEGIERIRKAMKTRIISKETKQKMSNSMKGRIPANKGKHHTKESKQKMSNAKIGKYNGEKNIMFGKEPFDIWVEKYGIEEAEKRKKDLYEKRSKTLKIIECEICHKKIPLNVYNRCHGNKCKYKRNEL
jgi:group I intron endonuclease